MPVAGLSRVKGVRPSAPVLNATALPALQRCTTNGVADGSILAHQHGSCTTTLKAQQQVLLNSKFTEQQLVLHVEDVAMTS